MASSASASSSCSAYDQAYRTYNDPDLHPCMSCCYIKSRSDEQLATHNPLIATREHRLDTLRLFQLAKELAQNRGIELQELHEKKWKELNLKVDEEGYFILKTIKQEQVTKPSHAEPEKEKPKKKDEKLPDIGNEKGLPGYIGDNDL